MGDAMALIRRNEWQINMDGTCQSDRSGGGKQGWIDMSGCWKKGTYDILFYQHNTEALTYSIWSDNSFVKTLSNFHLPAISYGGIIRRKRGANGSPRRGLTRTDVDVPNQMRKFSETFHWIDKGNQVEAKFDLGGESHSHGWTPKLGYF